MNRNLILVLFVSFNFALMAGVAALMLGDPETQPLPNAMPEEAPQQAKADLLPAAPVVAPVPQSDKPAFGPAMDEADVERRWLDARANGQWDLARELYETLRSVRRQKNEVEVRLEGEKPVELGPTLGGPLGGVRIIRPGQGGVSELTEVPFEHLPRNSDGTAPMPFGRGSAGSWDTGNRARPGR